MDKVHVTVIGAGVVGLFSNNAVELGERIACPASRLQRQPAIVARLDVVGPK